jgi:hypothetical protein
MVSLIGPQPSSSKKKANQQWNTRYSILSGMYQERLDDWFEENPQAKKIPHDAREKILDEFLIEQTRQDSFMGIDFLNPDETATLADIPTDELEQIRAVLEAQNYPVTTQNILKVYLSQQ